MTIESVSNKYISSIECRLGMVLSTEGTAENEGGLVPILLKLWYRLGAPWRSLFLSNLPAWGCRKPWEDMWSYWKQPPYLGSPLLSWPQPYAAIIFIPAIRDEQPGIQGRATAHQRSPSLSMVSPTSTLRSDFRPSPPSPALFCTELRSVDNSMTCVKHSLCVSSSTFHTIRVEWFWL